MPGVVAAAIGWAAGAVAGVLTTSAIISFALRAVATMAVSGLVNRALGGRAARGGGGAAANPVASARNRLVNLRQPISPWQVIYGEARVGGALTYAHVPPANRNLLHLVVTVSGHECAALGDVWFAEHLVSLDGAGNATGRFAGLATVHRSTGAEIGQPFPALVATGGPWGEGWAQRGRAKLALTLTSSAEVYAGGVPTVTVLARGRMVLDPRDGVTRWTNNAALCVADYLRTPATQFGLGATAGEVDNARLIAAANVCDERVPLAQTTSAFTADPAADSITVAAGARMPAIREGVRVTSTGTLPGGLAANTTYHVLRGPNGTIRLATTDANALAGVAIDITSAGTGTHSLIAWDEPRYTCDGTFTADAEPRVVLGLLLAAMAGKAVYSGGRWMIFAGAYITPTLSLSEDDLTGPLRTQALASRRESANALRGVYTDHQSWQPTSFPPVRSTAAATQDGETVWRDIDLAAFVVRASQAQRLAKIELLSSREALTVEADFRLRAWRAQTGGNVLLSFARYGWVAKPFEVLMARFVVGADGQLAVRLTLRETAAAIYDWATSEEQAGRIAPNTNLPSPGVVGPPGPPSITEALYETRAGRGVAAMAIITWLASDYPYGPIYQVEYRRLGQPDFVQMPLTSATRAELHDVAPGVYDWRVRAWGVTGAASPYSAIVRREIGGLGAPPAAPVIRGLQVAGGLAILTLDPSPDLDVRRGGRWRVRHSEAMIGASWEGSFSIGEHAGYEGDQTILVLPLKGGSYLVRAEDSTGQQGAVVVIATKQASILPYTPVGAVIEDPLYPGAHSGTVATDGVLTLQGVAQFDSIASLDAVSNLDAHSGILLSGTYQFAAGFDFGAVSRRRITSQIAGIIINVLDRIDERTAPIDEWADFDGIAAGANVDAWVEFRETDSDPSSGIGWSDWKRLDATEVNARGVQLRLQLSNTDPATNIRITQLRALAAAI